jgi:hypothetical protein
MTNPIAKDAKTFRNTINHERIDTLQTLANEQSQNKGFCKSNLPKNYFYQKI